MNVKERYDLAMKNAAFVLDKIAHAKKGDNIVVLADQPRYRNARLFCECAKNLGINAVILDFDIYGGDDKFMKMPIMEPVRQAILHADITFMVTPQILTGFDYYIGDQSSADKSLTGVGKRYTFEIDGLDQWEINEEEVLANFTRARNLYSWLRKANEVHVTTKRGTDLRVKVGSAPDGMYPVLGIIPFYSEVAIVPSFHSVNGIVVVDGGSENAYHQHGAPIRPNLPGRNETYMEPLTMVYRDSYLTEYHGPRIQVERLDRLMRDVDPKPELCDELGIVTTTSVENSLWGWQVDHSHQIHCVHVAIGNNHDRGRQIHSTEHIDFDVHDPILDVDGQVFYKDGRFDDELINSMA